MAGHYELKKSGATGAMFNLKAGNHEVILTSGTYTSKDAALVATAVDVAASASQSRNEACQSLEIGNG